MQLTGFDRLLWASGFAAHLLLLLVLVLRRHFRQFPVFTGLIFSNVLRSVVLYEIQLHGSRSGYFYSFWTLGILDTLLELAVVIEMYALTFRPLGRWAPDVRGLFKRLAIFGACVAVVLTWLAAPHARVWQQVVVIRGNFFSSVGMSELFVGMIAVSVKTGLPSKTYVARISQGLGLYSIIDVVIETGHSYFGVSQGVRAYRLLSHLRMSTYLFCVLYWIVMLWRSAPAPKDLPRGLIGQLNRLQNVVESDLERIRMNR